jgi:hypothetical protein
MLTSVFAEVTTVGFETPSMEPVPQPSTWAMILLGFSGVGFLASPPIALLWREDRFRRLLCLRCAIPE